MTDDPVQAAAERIRSAYLNRRPCAPVRELIGAADIDAAYAVQEANTTRWIADGRVLSGRKIGLTSAAVQKQLGVDQPDFGMLFADMAYEDGVPIPAGRFLQPKAEGEIALVLDRPLEGERHTPEDIAKATAYAVAAIEIVDSRIAAWDIRIADTIADNASSGGYVLGRERRQLADLDLLGCRMRMERSGALASEGTGAACLGNPLHAAVWLADMMVARGRPLGAGDVILTGALGPMAAVSPGDRVTLSIEGLGSVRADFSAG